MSTSLTSNSAYEPLNKYDKVKPNCYYINGGEVSINPIQNERGLFNRNEINRKEEESSSQESAIKDRLDDKIKEPVHDVWFTFFFILNFLAMIILTIYGIIHQSKCTHHINTTSPNSTKLVAGQAVQAITNVHAIGGHSHSHSDHDHNEDDERTQQINDVHSHLSEMLIHKRDEYSVYNSYVNNHNHDDDDDEYYNLFKKNDYIPHFTDAAGKLVSVFARHEDDYPKHFKEAVDIINVTHQAAKNGLHRLYWICGAILAVLTSLVIAFVFLFILKYYTKAFLYSAYTIQVFLWLALSIFSFIKHKYGLGTIFLLLFLVYVLLTPRFLTRMPLSVVLITEVLRCMIRFPSLYFASLIGVVIKFGILILWMACVGNIWIYSDNHQLSVASKIALGVYYSFSLLWISGTVNALINMTVSGVFATYFHFGYESHLNNRIEFPPFIKNPTFNSAKRALRYSFGSACFGSVFLAIIRVLKLLLNIIKPVDATTIFTEYVFNSYTFLFGTIEEIIQYFTHHTYVTISIFGGSFLGASKRTKEMFRSRIGFDSVASDIIIHATLTMCLIFSALFSGILCFSFSFIETAFEKQVDFQTKLYFAYYMVAIGFACCFMFSSVITEVIHSGVCTTFVCLVECPAVVLEKQPTLAAAAESAFDYIDVRS